MLLGLGFAGYGGNANGRRARIRQSRGRAMAWSQREPKQCNRGFLRAPSNHRRPHLSASRCIWLRGLAPYPDQTQE
jgi:hypothetical protein